MNRRERGAGEGKEAERRVWQPLLTVNWKSERKFWGNIFNVTEKIREEGNTCGVEMYV